MTYISYIVFNISIILLCGLDSLICWWGLIPDLSHTLDSKCFVKPSWNLNILPYWFHVFMRIAPIIQWSFQLVVFKILAGIQYVIGLTIKSKCINKVKWKAKTVCTAIIPGSSSNCDERGSPYIKLRNKVFFHAGHCPACYTFYITAECTEGIMPAQNGWDTWFEEILNRPAL